MHPFLTPDHVYKYLPFLVLDLVLKGFALWRAARREQTYWFIALVVVSSLGILPAIYLLLNPEGKRPAKLSKGRK